MARRMPVLRQHHVREQAAQPVDRPDHRLPVRHRQRPAGQEIALHVYDEEDVLSWIKLQHGYYLLVRHRSTPRGPRPGKRVSAGPEPAQLTGVPGRTTHRTIP